MVENNPIGVTPSMPILYKLTCKKTNKITYMGKVTFYNWLHTHYGNKVVGTIIDDYTLVYIENPSKAQLILYGDDCE